MQYKTATYPVDTSHILIVLSLEDETMWSPLGTNVTEDTLWSWPIKTRKKLLYVHSFQMTQNYFKRQQTIPLIVLTHSKRVKSQSFTVISAEQETKKRDRYKNCICIVLITNAS